MERRFKLKRLIEEKKAFVIQLSVIVEPRAPRQIAVVKGEIERERFKNLFIGAVVLDSG
jgi:cell division ATPase FtsA